MRIDLNDPNRMTRMDAPLEHYLIRTDGRVYNTKTGNWLTWRTNVSGYRCCDLTAPGRKRKTLTLHQAILIGNDVQIPDGMVVDHIDGDRNNNTFTNLRVVTPSANNRNSDRSRNAKGYTYRKREGKFQVQLKEQGRHLSFGAYATEAEAAAVVAKAKAHFDTHNTYAGFAI